MVWGRVALQARPSGHAGVRVSRPFDPSSLPPPLSSPQQSGGIWTKHSSHEKDRRVQKAERAEQRLLLKSRHSGVKSHTY